MVITTTIRLDAKSEECVKDYLMENMKDGYCADTEGILGEGSWVLDGDDLVWHPSGGTNGCGDFSGIIVDLGKEFVNKLHRKFDS